MSTVVFRPAASADAPALLAMMRRLAAHEPGAYHFDEQVVRDALRTFLADPALGRAWMFFDEETPIGYVILTFGYSFEYHGRDAFIDELYIEPRYRRQGLGRRAMEFVEDRARELRVHALHLELDAGNDPAAGLYRRSGYADHQRHLMTKWLSCGRP